MEPDYLLYSKVPPHWTPVQNGGGNVARKIFATKGVQGGGSDFWEPPLAGGFGGSAPEAKNICKIAL